MTRRTIFLAAAAALVLGGAPARADGVDDAIKTFEDYLKTKPEPDGIVNQIGDLAQKHDPRVAKALIPLLRHKEEVVKIAVCQNIGKQKDPSVAGVLKSVYEAADKEKPERFKVMAAALEGIGDADAKANFDFLLKAAKKLMPKHGEASAAGFRACANHLTRETIGELVYNLGVADYTTTGDSAAKRAAYNIVRNAINDTLRKVTGKEISDVKIWKKWWDDNEKTWKPPSAGGDSKKDINAGDSFKDPDYGFEIKKPNTRWIFRKPEGGGQHYLTMEALDEGQRAAWCELYIVGAKSIKEKTPELMSEFWKGQFEAKFRDFKEQDWDKKVVISGEKGVEHMLFGQHKDHDAIRMRNFIVSKNEIMFSMITYWKSGKGKPLQDDIDELFTGGFKFLKD